MRYIDSTLYSVQLEKIVMRILLLYGCAIATVSGLGPGFFQKLASERNDDSKFLNEKKHQRKQTENQKILRKTCINR